ncbi:hypothetical protein BH23ACT11_BH23ACT11_20290 [soil metagenome]
MGRRGLGRGLSALIATGESVGGLKFEEIPVSAIRSNAQQPRNSFPEEGIQELAASIKEVGILQPLVVRSTDSGFELIAGERRLRAAKEAELERVPVLIRSAGDNESMELALVENLQREDLNPLETAAAYQALLEGFGLTKEQLADRVGKSRVAVTNTLRLVQLPDGVQKMVLEGSLTEGHARALLGVEDEEEMRTLARRIRIERLSVRATEQLVRDHSGRANDPPTPDSPDVEIPEQFEAAARTIGEELGLHTKVKPYRQGGKVEIRFRQLDQLEALVALLTNTDPGK